MRPVHRGGWHTSSLCLAARCSSNRSTLRRGLPDAHIKLKESFITSDTIDYFMEQPDGANYVVLYQLLCLKTISTGGRQSRQIGEITIPYDVAKIQRDCKWFSADTIRVALNLYLSVGLICEDVDGTLVLTDHKNLVGSETDYAVQKEKPEKKSAAASVFGCGHCPQ